MFAKEILYHSKSDKGKLNQTKSFIITTKDDGVYGNYTQVSTLVNKGGEKSYCHHTPLTLWAFDHLD